MASHDISVPTPSISFPPALYHEPAWFGTTHTHLHTTSTPSAVSRPSKTLSSVDTIQVSMGPPTRARRDTDIGIQAAEEGTILARKEESVQSETSRSATTHPKPTSKMAARERTREHSDTAIQVTTHYGPTPGCVAREAIQNLNSETIVKVATKHGPTPHRSAHTATYPSRSVNWPTVLQRKLNPVTKRIRVAEDLERENARAWRREEGEEEEERERKEQERQMDKGSRNDYIFHAIGIVPGTHRPRPALSPSSPPPPYRTRYVNPTSLPTTLPIPLSTIISTTPFKDCVESNPVPPPTTPVRAALVGVSAPSSALSPSNQTALQPFGFEFDLPPFPPLLFGVLVTGLIAGAVAAVVLYFVNFPPAFCQAHKRKEDGWESVDSVSGTTSTVTSRCTSPSSSGSLRSRAGPGRGRELGPRPTNSSPTNSRLHHRTLSHTSQDSAAPSAPSALSLPLRSGVHSRRGSEPPTRNGDDISLQTFLPSPLRTSTGQPPRSTRQPTPLDLCVVRGRPAQRTAPPTDGKPSVSRGGQGKARSSELERQGERAHFGTAASSPSSKSRFLYYSGSDERLRVGASVYADGQTHACSVERGEDGFAASDEEAQTPVSSPRGTLLSGSPLRGVSSSAVFLSRAGGWLKRIDGVVERAVENVAKWTADEGRR